MLWNSTFRVGQRPPPTSHLAHTYDPEVVKKTKPQHPNHPDHRDSGGLAEVFVGGGRSGGLRTHAIAPADGGSKVPSKPPPAVASLPPNPNYHTFSHGAARAPQLNRQVSPDGFVRAGNGNAGLEASTNYKI